MNHRPKLGIMRKFHSVDCQNPPDMRYLLNYPQDKVEGIATLEDGPKYRVSAQNTVADVCQVVNEVEDRNLGLTTSKNIFLN